MSMRKRLYAAAALLLLYLMTACLTGCRGTPPETYSRDIFAMDTYINCQIVSHDQALAEKGLDQVEAVFMEVDLLTDRFDTSSEVSEINRNAGIRPVRVSEDVLAMVQTALAWSDKTEGAFNILIGSAMDLWGFGSDHPAIPSSEQLADALGKSDYRQIVTDASQSTVYLPQAGMVMDLGGIAKGYATDKAVAALRELNIENALINAGGNVYALGTRADGTLWKVGVQDPRNPQGIAAVLEGDDCALVSSGDYERYFEVDGIRYHHILDPQTGYPARASTGTTVIMESSTAADILSTALFIKGPARGIQMADSLPEVKAVMIITEDGRMYTSKGFGDYRVDKQDNID